jgi:hypothetical protein
MGFRGLFLRQGVIVNIIMRSVPSVEMRYDTLGDWQFLVWPHEEGIAEYLKITVPHDAGLNSKEQFLIGFHELVEAAVCKARGITQQQVDDFDFNFDGEGEPGDDPACPYREAHRFAMLMEHLLAREIGVQDYGTVG